MKHEDFASADSAMHDITAAASAASQATTASVDSPRANDKEEAIYEREATKRQAEQEEKRRLEMQRKLIGELATDPEVLSLRSLSPGERGEKLHDAARSGDSCVILRLLAASADVNHTRQVRCNFSPQQPSRFPSLNSHTCVC